MLDMTQPLATEPPATEPPALEPKAARAPNALANRRIFYFCPDFPQPSGGTKKLYRHVQRLVAAGVEAAIVHQRSGFRLDWHLYRAPVVALEDRPRFTTSDILVFPEIMLDMMRQTQGFGGQRAVIALSWLPTYAKLRPGERWSDHGIAHALTTSPHIRRHLAWSQGIDAALIPEYVDPTHYAYRRAEKQRQIAYLTRKDASGEWLSGVLARRQPALDAFAWQPLRNLDEAAYAQRMRAASLFVTTTLQEGMHVSVLEAMACGALVVGFPAVGGEDFMTSANSLPVENGNLLLLGQTLERALLDLLADPAHFDAHIAAAQATVRRFQDAKAETDALLAFFTALAEPEDEPKGEQPSTQSQSD
jgi:hypothetical protein